MVLTLLVLEAVFRLAGYPGRIERENPVLSRRLRELDNRADDRGGGGPYMLLSPYFGYTNVPGSESVHGRSINNLGFASPVDFPYRRRESGEFVIVFFGGSVAEILTVEAGGYLEELIEESPAWRSRPVTVLTCATGAYKQPQQMLILSYLLARGMEMDCVVNVDGFNEVAVAMINRKKGTDIFYPSVFYWEEMLKYLSGGTRGMISRPEYLDLAARRQQALVGESRALRRLLFSPCRRSALGSFVLGRLYGAAARKVERIHSRLGEMAEEIAPAWERKVRRGPREDDGLEGAVDLWRSTSVMMDQLCRLRGIRYLHVLQPNQYDPEGKELTSAELTDAFNPSSPFIPGARLGYPLLRKAGRDLVRGGVEFLDLSRIFNGRPEDIYVDDCCHFNTLGNRLVMEEIAAALLSPVQGENSAGASERVGEADSSRK